MRKLARLSLLSCALLTGLIAGGCESLNNGICAVLTCEDLNIYDRFDDQRRGPTDAEVIEGLRKAREAEAREAERKNAASPDGTAAK